jgi:hypothetical protein
MWFFLAGKPGLVLRKVKGKMKTTTADTRYQVPCKQSCRAGAAAFLWIFSSSSTDGSGSKPDIQHRYTF